MFDFVQVTGHDFGHHEADKLFWGNLANCKIGLHLIYPVLNRELRAALERGNFALHATMGSALGSLKGGTIENELSFALVVDLLVTFVFIGVIVRIVGST